MRALFRGWMGALLIAASTAACSSEAPDRPGGSGGAGGAGEGAGPATGGGGGAGGGSGGAGGAGGTGGGGGAGGGFACELGSGLSPAPPGSVVFGVMNELVGYDVKQLHAVVRVAGVAVLDAAYGEGAPRPLSFPMQLVVPDVPDGADVEVEIEVPNPYFQDGFLQPVRVLARTQGVAGEAPLVRVRIQDTCVSFDPDQPVCEAASTCRGGRCVDPYWPPSSLEPHAPSWPCHSFCKPEAAGPPEVRLGHGYSAFVPLEDLDVIDPIAGGQGGHHVWLAVRMRNLRQLSTVKLTGHVLDLGHDIGPSIEMSSFNEDPISASCDTTRFFFVLDGSIAMSELFGMAVELSLEVTDADGAVGQDVRTVSISNIPISE